ncbi:hypothetical protein VTK26DRAFT_2339 [Humicola hyalothermophila]
MSHHLPITYMGCKRYTVGYSRIFGNGGFAAFQVLTPPAPEGIMGHEWASEASLASREWEPKGKPCKPCPPREVASRFAYTSVLVMVYGVQKDYYVCVRCPSHGEGSCFNRHQSKRTNLLWTPCCACLASSIWGPRTDRSSVWLTSVASWAQGSLSQDFSRAQLVDTSNQLQLTQLPPRGSGGILKSTIIVRLFCTIYQVLHVCAWCPWLGATSKPCSENGPWFPCSTRRTLQTPTAAPPPPDSKLAG